MRHSLPQVLVLGAALAATRPALAQANARAHTGSEAAAPVAAPRALSVKPAQVGRGAPEPEGNEFFPDFSRFPGRLVYAWDNAHYSSGFNWPWQSYLVERVHSAELPGAASAARPVQSHEVQTPSSAFVYEPKYLPGGQSLLFKAGDPTNSAGTYDLYWFKPSARQLQQVARGLSYRNVWLSPSGRFVAYIAGAWEIPLRGGVTPAELHVFDLQTSTDFLIRPPAEGSGAAPDDREPLLNTIAWAAGDRLIYNLTPPSRKAAARVASSAPPKPWFPDLYQADLLQAAPKPAVRTGSTQPKLLASSLWLPNAYRAVPSPDGQWLALLRDETPQPQAAKAPSADVPQSATAPPTPRSINLILLNPRTGNRLLVEAAKRSTTQVMWSPDSKRLLMLSRQAKGAVGSGAGRKALVQIQVAEFDVEAQKQRKVGAADYVAPPGSDIREDNPLFRPLCISRDGKWLFMEMLQFEEKPNNGLLLKAMRLQDGQMLPLCRLISVRRLDWFDETPPATETR